MTRNFFEKHYYPKNLNLEDYKTQIAVPSEITVSTPTKLGMRKNRKITALKTVLSTRKPIARMSNLATFITMISEMPEKIAKIEPHG